MKNAVFFASGVLLCLLLLQNHLTAQDTTRLQTLFGNGSRITLRDIGIFVAPTAGVTQIDGNNTIIFNFRSGFNFKDKFSIGGYFSSTDELYPRNVNNTGTYMEYWTTGGFMEYTLSPKKLVHLTLPLFFGYGEVEMYPERRDDEYDEDNFFQIEPSALLEINLHKFVRFNVGAGYRFIGQINNPIFDQADFSGPTGYLGLKMGLFR
ncbi:MAG: hypothetical protein RL386_1437 [Bacteroidota bacterium]|jgi:hypothetical protein